MNRKAIFLGSTLSLAIAVTGCNTASAPESANSAANTNANVNPIANANIPANTNNPIANVSPAPVGESKIPGIPDMPGTEKPIPKNDPTRTAKVQPIKRDAPDNSEITTSLGTDVTETRTFKNHPRIAKVEVIGMDKKTVKVYLKNGQVRELPSGKVADPLAESGDNILKALGAGEPAKGETKPAPPAAADDTQKKQ
jgi:hypothetical protein